MIDTEGVFELMNHHELDVALDHLVEIRKQMPLKKLRTLRNLHMSLRTVAAVSLTWELGLIELAFRCEDIYSSEK
jgi:hypothetical protein